MNVLYDKIDVQYQLDMFSNAVRVGCIGVGRGGGAGGPGPPII